MAFITEIFCHTCQKSKQEVVSGGQYPAECANCAHERKTRKEREWKAAREGLTIEERIRDLEHFMYHHGKHYEGPTIYG
jgi:hypothetical protein